MIDLTEVSGLPIRFDEERITVHCGEEVVYEKEFFVPLIEISPVLLNKSLRYPEVVYKHHVAVQNPERCSSLKHQIYDVIYMPFGLLGIECIKTHIYYSEPKKGKYDCVVEVLSGELTITMQKNKPRDEYLDYNNLSTPVEEINIVKLKKGQRLAIPTGYFYTFSNIGTSAVIFAKISSREHRPIDYNMLRREKGLAFYLISKNAKVEVVANPKYKCESKSRVITFDRLIKQSTDEDYLHTKLSKERRPVYKLFEASFFRDLIIA